LPEDFQMPRTLLDKVWEAHTVAELPSGQTQLFVGLHLVHEVTSPQAFQMLRELKLPVLFPSGRSRRWTTSSRRTPWRDRSTTNRPRP
jgi:homoaconitase/3-isopropylmalate dehydratase large subunit